MLIDILLCKQFLCPSAKSMFGLSSSKQGPDTAEYVNINTTIPPAGCEHREYKKLVFCFNLTVF